MFKKLIKLIKNVNEPCDNFTELQKCDNFTELQNDLQNRGENLINMMYDRIGDNQIYTKIHPNEWYEEVDGEILPQPVEKYTEHKHFWQDSMLDSWILGPEFHPYLHQYIESFKAQTIQEYKIAEAELICEVVRQHKKIHAKE